MLEDLESTEEANLGMLKMRWKKGFFWLDAECGEWGECPLFVVDVAVYKDGVPVGFEGTCSVYALGHEGRS